LAALLGPAAGLGAASDVEPPQPAPGTSGTGVATGASAAMRAPILKLVTAFVIGGAVGGSAVAAFAPPRVGYVAGAGAACVPASCAEADRHAGPRAVRIQRAGPHRELRDRGGACVRAASALVWRATPPRQGPRRGARARRSRSRRAPTRRRCGRPRRALPAR